MTAWGSSGPAWMDRAVTQLLGTPAPIINPGPTAWMDQAVAEHLGTPVPIINPGLGAAYDVLTGKAPAGLGAAYDVLTGKAPGAQIPPGLPHNPMFGSTPITNPVLPWLYPVTTAPVAWGTLPLREHSALKDPQVWLMLLTGALAVAGFGTGAAAIAALYATGQLAYAADREMTSPMDRLKMPTLAEFNMMTGRPIYTWPDGMAHDTPPTWPGYRGQIISKPPAPR